MLNAILRLRRDNHYNYAKIKDTFIPANGEICLKTSLLLVNLLPLVM